MHKRLSGRTDKTDEPTPRRFRALLRSKQPTRLSNPHATIQTMLQWVSFIAAITVIPTVGFWLTLRQDSVRWYREQRADLYVDLLTEADAERSWLAGVLARAEVAEIVDGLDPDRIKELDEQSAGPSDTRLEPYARARLGARAAAYASDAVVKKFNELQRTGFLFGSPSTPPQVRRFESDTAFDALEAGSSWSCGDTRRRASATRERSHARQARLSMVAQPRSYASLDSSSIAMSRLRLIAARTQ